MPEKAEKLDYRKSAGVRLRRVREALGLDQRGLANIFDKNGYTEDNISSWERGLALVRPQFVSLLRVKFGVTHDWIYDGVLNSLPGGLIEAITGVQVADAPPREPPTRRRGGERRRVNMPR